MTCERSFTRSIHSPMKSSNPIPFYQSLSPMCFASTHFSCGKGNSFNSGFTQEQVATVREKMLEQSRTRKEHNQTAQVQALTGKEKEAGASTMKRKRTAGSHLTENNHLPFQYENPMYSGEFGITGSATSAPTDPEADVNM